MLLKTYTYLFFLLLAADVAAMFTDWQGGHFLFKFLLMPVLFTALLQRKKTGREKNWRLIFAGLIMAWAGDVLLLFSPGMPLFFILGLVCFLCTHLAYIVYFNRYHRVFWRFIAARPLPAVVVLAYAGLLLTVLWPGLGNLLLPVVLYTVVISIMVLRAFAAQSHLSKTVAIQFIAGAILFVLSDSLLAFDKFYMPFRFANIAIMVTYGTAQWLIVGGGIANTDEKVVS